MLLLDVIGSDARASNAALARRLGTPPSTTFNRLAALQRRGVIIGFHTAIDRRSLALDLEVVIGVEMHSQDEGRVHRVVEAAKVLPHVLAVLRVSGRYDLLVQAAVSSSEALVPLVIEPLSSIPGVRRTDTSLVVEHWRRPGLLSPSIRH